MPRSVSSPAIAGLEFLTGFTSKVIKVINYVAQYLNVFIVAKQRFFLISRAGQEIT